MDVLEITLHQTFLCLNTLHLLNIREIFQNWVKYRFSNKSNKFCKITVIYQCTLWNMIPIQLQQKEPSATRDAQFLKYFENIRKINIRISITVQLRQSTQNRFHYLCDAVKVNVAGERSGSKEIKIVDEALTVLSISKITFQNRLHQNVVNWNLRYNNLSLTMWNACQSNETKITLLYIRVTGNSCHSLLNSETHRFFLTAYWDLICDISTPLCGLSLKFSYHKYPLLNLCEK